MRTCVTDELINGFWTFAAGALVPGSFSMFLVNRPRPVWLHEGAVACHGGVVRVLFSCLCARRQNAVHWVSDETDELLSRNDSLQELDGIWAASNRYRVTALYLQRRPFVRVYLNRATDPRVHSRRRTHAIRRNRRHRRQQQQQQHRRHYRRPGQSPHTRPAVIY